jgi:hypothetical protein
MLKTILEPGKPQMTTWRMSFVCWIPKAANSHSEYVILIALPLQQWLQEGAWMLHYTCIVCLIVTTSLYNRNTTLQISCTWHLYFKRWMLPINTHADILIKKCIDLRPTGLFLRPHVEQFPDINKLCNVASCWIYLRCTDPQTLNLLIILANGRWNLIRRLKG